MREYFYPALSNKQYKIRAFQDTQGMSWWSGVDVCTVLGLANASQAISRLDPDEKCIVDRRTLDPLYNNEGVFFDKADDVLKSGNSLACINESGLYYLIITSRKPEAKRFRKWITSEVLPSIRKTGKYEARKTQTPPKRIALKASEIEKPEKIVEVRREKPKHEKGMPFPLERVRWLTEKDLKKERKQARGVDVQHRQHIQQLKREQDEAMADATEAELRTFKLAKGAGRHL